MQKFILTLFILLAGLSSSANLDYYQSTDNDRSIQLQDQVQETVFFNTKSHKFHKMSCIWAKKCTVNCVIMEKAEAILKGVPCKVCGG
ncbi:MAG: hypothetical protein HRT47_01800 [Candidatus Caenarcaniphilales bacterium]|nr:hypothetical protein [Candidatus Caenarcaniphilales bacterium]